MGLTVATVPLMVVAASLGALIAEVLPVNHIPTTVSLVGIVAVALAGTFVPVPMAFDVGVGRDAYALQGDTPKARAAYQDFFALWKDAYPDVPVLKAAKAEYEKLK